MMIRLMKSWLTLYSSCNFLSQLAIDIILEPDETTNHSQTAACGADHTRNLKVSGRSSTWYVHPLAEYNDRYILLSHVTVIQGKATH